MNRADSTLLNSETTTPPWDDLETVLRHAEQAQADRDSKRAYTFYARATELDSNNASAWAGRAATTPDVDDEIVSWAYTLALAPDNIQARIRLEQSLAEKVETSAIGDASTLYALARDLAEAGQKEYAHRLAARATELDDTKEEYWVWRAGLADDIRETISALNQALALNPESAAAQAGLNWALVQQAKAVSPATPSAAEEARQFLAEGRAQLEKGDRELAYEMFKHATEMDQRNEEAWFLRGITVEDKEIDEALTCMEQVLAINPGHDEAKGKRSWLRVRKLREGTVKRKDARAMPVSAVAPVSAGKPIRMETIRLVFLTGAVLALIVLLAFLLRS